MRKEGEGITKEHKIYMQELGISGIITDVKRIGQVWNRHTFRLGEAVEINRGFDRIILYRKFGEKEWIIERVFSKIYALMEYDASPVENEKGRWGRVYLTFGREK